ncbi:MAG: hypothetical protein A2940_01320 [Candidatus Wildermuthbacteria bacterium RIFCSPLOWO2_01_FULL_48_29]|uniref:Cell division protein FtsL n=2 Tax=Candidatus Wildermuthiibacteriota TaxID=1817923 RepID=A0A1G2RKG9_9BACT|nr:MAG: hypothetical protein A2843_01875 [Candidatus Wildermuthbacteria bacterium RIFCSPHIGHO2_01_FULL_48_27b]OHA73344.1 MAG: hypothetical protein A2940_01320 [Candidatus Wildermuthbacteria bacterium RIFCSPLOWO2_01_FULL_48_29]
MTILLSSSYHTKIFWVLGLLFTGFLIGLYIIQVNALTILVYRIAGTERQIAEHRHANTALQVQANQAVPFKDLEQLAQSRNFERVRSITYLKIPSGGVAQNQ